MTSSNSSAPIRAGPSVSRRGRMADRLGIVAGDGALPRHLVECCRAAGRDVFVLAVEGAAEPATVEGVPHAWCRLGAAADGLAFVRKKHFAARGLGRGRPRPALGAVA